MTPDAKFKIAHTGKNLIYIDSCSSDQEQKDKPKHKELLKRKDYKILIQMIKKNKES